MTDTMRELIQALNELPPDKREAVALHLLGVVAGVTMEEAMSERRGPT